MDISSVAALATNLAQQKLMTDVGIANLKRTLEMAEASGEMLISAVSDIAVPDLSSSLDISI